MAGTPNKTVNIGNEAESDENYQQNLKNVVNNHNQEDRSSSPVVHSLDGKIIDDIPDFVQDTQESSYQSTGRTQFAPAATDPSKPNITEIHYQNMTNGNASWVTWMQPGGTVRIWFSVKGPISISGPIILVQFRAIVSESSAYGAYFVEASMNSWDIGENETLWFTWDRTIPDEGSGNYGWGTGKCNAFT